MEGHLVGEEDVRVLMDLLMLEKVSLTLYSQPLKHWVPCSQVLQAVGKNMIILSL